MKTYRLRIKGTSALLQTKYNEVEKLSRETHKDYEERTWQRRLHLNEDGRVIIPAYAFHKALQSIAQYLGIQIPGQGKKTYTAKFKGGVMIDGDLVTNCTKDNVQPHTHLASATGKSVGNQTKVPKTFPCLLKWEAETTIIILDDIITREVLMDHLTQCGLFNGIGAYRPQNGGGFGRFMVESLTEI
jgi:hypothetical protein